jgi:hypothetical protein
VPFREVAAHTRLELIVWVTALERYQILKSGKELEDMASSGHTISGEESLLMNRYQEELTKLGEDKRNGQESD